MGERWTDYEIQRDFTDWRDLCDAHNADCDAYEARIAELERTLLASAEETRRAFNATLTLGFEIKDARAIAEGRDNG